MAILKLDVNSTYTLALKYKSGKEARSQYDGNPQLMFTLSDGRILYLPVDVADSITALNLGPQEPFLLTKLSTANKITWVVERVPAPAQPGPQLVPNGKSKAELMTELGDVLVNGAPEAKPAANGVNRFYLDRAEALIDVFAAANKYAAEHHSGAVSKEDVRALCISVFIQCTPKPAQARNY